MTTKYSKERKEAIINKMLPPSSMSVTELAKQEKIPYGTLYTWKQLHIAKTRQDEEPKSENTNVPTKQWTAEQKLATIIETSTLSEQECHEYCRKNGLYSADIESWKAVIIKGTEQNVAHVKTDKNELKKLRSENNSLKKELYRKEKALAETAALLVLRKKLDALWEENEDA
ncbi:MAG: transposase [Methyloprofundus sp.]|nr:transposase [Methyloprofundus sp.]